VFVKVLQADDLITTAAGTGLFGTAALISPPDDSQQQAEPPVLESAVATVGEEHRCTWTKGTDDAGIDVDNDDSLEILTLPAAGGNSTDADTDAGVDTDADAWPTLRLELKRRALLRIFDSAVAACDVSIVPLLVHPIEAGVWDVEMALAPSLFPSPLPPLSKTFSPRSTNSSSTRRSMSGRSIFSGCSQSKRSRLII
jgi:hypothetical protein